MNLYLRHDSVKVTIISADFFNSGRMRSSRRKRKFSFSFANCLGNRETYARSATKTSLYSFRGENRLLITVAIDTSSRTSGYDFLKNSNSTLAKQNRIESISMSNIVIFRPVTRRRVLHVTPFVLRDPKDVSAVFTQNRECRSSLHVYA